MELVLELDLKAGHWSRKGILGRGKVQGDFGDFLTDEQGIGQGTLPKRKRLSSHIQGHYNLTVVCKSN